MLRSVTRSPVDLGGRESRDVRRPGALVARLDGRPPDQHQGASERERRQRHADASADQGHQETAQAERREQQRKRAPRAGGEREGEPEGEHAPGDRGRHADAEQNADEDPERRFQDLRAYGHEAASTGLRVSSSACWAAAGSALPSPPATVTVGTAKRMPFALNAFLIIA